LKPRYVVGAVALVAVIALIPHLRAQTPTRRPAGPVDAATRALVEGRYDDVASLTASLPQDPAAAALRARADIARGRYEQAESALRPIAQRSPTSDAALQLGLLLKMLDRPEADAVLQRVAEASATDPAALAREARANQALDPMPGAVQNANSLYRDASHAAPHDPAINTAWGDMFLLKGKNADAMTSYKQVLDDDPKWEPALVGAAKAIIDDDPPQAQKLAQQALTINPNDVEAMIFLAGQTAVEPAHRGDARKTLQKALDVNPNSLDAHALLGALNYVEDNKDGFEAEARKTLAIAPRYGEFFRVASMLTSRNYRFEEAAALARRGLELEPKNPDTLTELGLDLLRTGDEDGARKALDASWDIDKFSLVTLDLLNMMDQLDKFVTVRDGDVILRISKDEAPVLQDAAMALTHRALDTLGKRYGMTPKGPFLVEIFPRHDDFAVRTAGLPGMIGALGACFGRVVTMESPQAENQINFHWEATLWHELAHVITLQMSEQRIPRWLTEGISVHEQGIATPEWGRAQDMEFAAMMGQNQVIKLKELNDAFQNPQLISIAYFEGSVLVDYIVQAFGDDGLHKLVRAYATGVDTDAALKSELNTSFEQMQGGFDAYLEKRFGAMARALTPPKEKVALLDMKLPDVQAYASSHPDEFGAQMMLGGRSHEAGEDAQAIKAYEKAAALVPKATGAESPHAKLAEIYVDQKDRKKAIAELKTLLAVDLDNLKAARQLASLMKDEGVTDPAQLRPVYARITALDPFEGETHSQLGRLELAQNDADAASHEFKVALALKPVDLAAAHADYAESLYRGGKLAEARKETLASLEIAPSYERAQDLLLTLSGNRH
jgi:tetratricopeptide (TPR) repeat protein